MFWTILGFELRQRARRASTWINFGLFFGASFLLSLMAAGAWEGADLGMSTGGKVMVNSPYQLAALLSGLSFFTLLVNAAVAGRAVSQDFSERTYPLFFTAPIPRAAYLGGRFAAALVVLIFIHLSLPLGLWLGSLMPFVDRTLIGPNRALAYLHPFLVLVLPNLLSQAAGFFSIGALTRRMRAAYLASMLVVVGYTIAGVLSERIEDRLLAALLDPFGSFAVERATEYFTVVEKNLRLIPLSGILLWNRLLWLGLTAGLLIFTYRRFRMSEPLLSVRSRPMPAESSAPPPVSAQPAVASDPVPPTSSLAAALGIMGRFTWLSFRQLVRKPSFLIILVSGIGTMIIAARTSGAIFGTETYPVTYAMVELAGTLSIYVLLLLTLSAGELVHRDREKRTDQLLDALPVPTWVFVGSRLCALVLMVLLVQLAGMVTGIGVQLFQGYTRLELGLYVTQLFGLRTVGIVHTAVLVLFLHVLVNHKALGHLAMVGWFLLRMALPRLGLEHPLIEYGQAPRQRYSDMNGFGESLGAWGWFSLHWTLAAVLLVLLTNLLWVRGQERSFRMRLRLARARLGSLPMRLGLGLSAAAFAGTGAFIFHNTNVLNEWKTSKQVIRETAEYERTYKRHEKEPQPSITDVKVAFDIYPESGFVRTSGRYVVTNQTGSSIPEVHLTLPHRVRIHRLRVADATAPSRADSRLDFYSFRLPRPLPPGATAELEFDLEYGPRGFTGGGRPVIARRNGTFVSSSFLPSLGYDPNAELADDDQRRRQGLGPRPRMPALEDVRARQRNYISQDAHFVRLEATACTSPDQVAIVPGYLQREWSERGRRCFAYRSESPVLHFFSVLSARYQVRRDRWKDVAIEIHHHPGHEYNLDRMIRSVKESLEYFSAHFSPYQHRQLRILEFPRYSSYAQSFPNTIPYSESVGFIARVDPDDPKDIDYPTYITAHEVAHQWWAHQIVGAHVQGATLLSESLAEYSALMVMKKLRGEHEMKRFLRYELDRYLAARGSERKGELPLMRVEGQQHIHYAKAAVVFYHLQDQVGETTVNRALASLLREHAFRGPPYPTSLDLLTHLKREIPTEQHGLLTDLLETITLYENRAVSASVEPQPDGRYRVKLKVAARKLRADELGKEKEIPFRDSIDVGVLDAEGKPLLLEKRPISAGESELVLDVPKGGRPAQAGIDPLNKLIDRTPADNLTKLKL